MLPCSLVASVTQIRAALKRFTVLADQGLGAKPMPVQEDHEEVLAGTAVLAAPTAPPPLLGDLPGTHSDTALTFLTVAAAFVGALGRSLLEAPAASCSGQPAGTGAAPAVGELAAQLRQNLQTTPHGRISVVRAADGKCLPVVHACMRVCSWLRVSALQCVSRFQGIAAGIAQRLASARCVNRPTHACPPPLS